MTELSPHIVRAALGLLIGSVLGYAARRGSFCSMGAIEDAVYSGDTRRLRSWGLAVAVAILGTAALQLVGLDLSGSVYGGARLELGGLLIGGFAFGFGMALVGTCAFGSLLRLAGGDLKAFVVALVIALSSLMAMRGLTGLARVTLIDPLAIELPRGKMLPALLDLEPAGRLLIAAAIGTGLVAAMLRSRSFRRETRPVVSGLVIGACVVAGWAATSIIGADPFGTERPVSLSFARPVGDTVLYAMLASGSHVDFGVATVVGVVVGGAVAALAAGRFRWEAPDDPRELKRHLLGAFLMGTGGVMALGCTVGQGITGLATLSIGSILAVLAVAAGARAGLYFLVERGAA